jgi:membrane protease YdiL (CAAX protease family)
MVWVCIFLYEAKLKWSEAFGLRAIRWFTAVGIGIGAGLSFLPPGFLCQFGCKWALEKVFHLKANPQEIVNTLSNPDVSMAQIVFIGVVAVLAAPVVEEILFRGILYPTLKRTRKPWLAAISTSLLFGAFHLNLMSFLPLSIFSLLLIYLYEKNGSLLPSILAHATFNLANFLLLVFQEPISNWLKLQ